MSVKVQIFGAFSLSALTACMPPPQKPLLSSISSAANETSGTGDATPSDTSSTGANSDTTTSTSSTDSSTSSASTVASTTPSTSTTTTPSTTTGNTSTSPTTTPTTTTPTTGSTALACDKGDKFTFSNYPASWSISGTGRIKDAMDNEKVITDADKGKVLQVKYGKGTSSPSASRTRDLVPGGTQFVPELKNTYEQAMMSYWLKIPADFNCVKGGKLPGIASNIDLISGGETADGRNGFSVRLMWRENCTAEVYAYIPREENAILTTKYKDTFTQNATTGIIYGWSIGRGEFSFTKGKWTKVDLSVHVNTVGKADGSVQVALDGKQVFERKEIVFRTSDKLKVGALFFSTFFGGSDETYAATKDEYLYFGDMSVCPI